MVGGRIINIVQLSESTWIQCEEKLDDGLVCAIRIHGQVPTVQMGPQSKRRVMQPGDSIWWQGRNAFWTPEPRMGVVDLPLSRMGHSHTTVPIDVMETLAVAA